jgi:cullin 3
MRATFKARKHDLNVSTYAMVILMLFNNVNEGDSLSFTVGLASNQLMTGH